MSKATNTCSWRFCNEERHFASHLPFHTIWWRSCWNWKLRNMTYCRTNANPNLGNNLSGSRSGIVQSNHCLITIAIFGYTIEGVCEHLRSEQSWDISGFKRNWTRVDTSLKCIKSLVDFNLLLFHIHHPSIVSQLTRINPSALYPSLNLAYPAPLVNSFNSR